MKLSYILPILLAAMLPATSAAQSVPGDSAQVLSLDDCVRLTMTNNRNVAIAANDVRAAAETRAEAFTKYFPEISASGAWFKTHHDVFQYNVLDLFTIGIINGGKFGSIQALQPIFMGGRIVNGNRLAEVGEQAARLRQNLTLDQLRLSTEQYYWNLNTLQASRTTVASAIEMLDTLTRQVSAAVEAGVAMKNDLLKVKLKRNSFEADMVDLDNGIKLVRMLLAQAMGADTARVVIAPAVPEEVPATPRDIFIESGRALPQTDDYRLLQKNVEAKELEKRMEVGNHLPSVALGAGWFAHDVFDQWHNFGAIGITLAIPISGWWGGSHAIKRKNLELENARSSMADLSQKLEIEMQSKWDDVTSAHRKMCIALEAVGQADENLRLNRAYYDAGMSTITDLLDAETSRKEARTAYITAYGAFKVACAAYLNATGQRTTRTL